MNERDLVAALKESLDRQLSWIAAADGKTGTAFGLSTAMLGVLAALAPPVGQWTTASAIAAAFAFVLQAIALLLSTAAAFPRVTGPKGSLVFFGGIATRSRDDFEEEMRSVSAQAYVRDLTHQCHRNAEIAQAKYAHVQRSMAALYLSVLPWLIAVYMLYSAKGEWA